MVYSFNIIIFFWPQNRHPTKILLLRFGWTPCSAQKTKEYATLTYFLTKMKILQSRTNLPEECILIDELDMLVLIAK